MSLRTSLAFNAAVLLALAPLQAQKQQPKPQGGKAKPAEQIDAPSKDDKPQRKRVVSDLSGFDLLSPNRTQSQPTVVGATRTVRQPAALAPRLGKVLGSNPQFAWSYEGKAPGFLFVLRDDTYAEVFRTEVVGTKFTYPPDAPLLQPGKTYLWTVDLQSRLLAGNPSSPVGILVISKAQREEIEKKLAQMTNADAYQAGQARAQLFTEYRLWYDALAAYDDLIARYPDRAELHEQRGTIYAQLPTTNHLAEEDFNRAEQLKSAR